MGNFANLIHDPDLYPQLVIQTYLSTYKNWEVLSDRTKEKILAHLMTCIYLCNMQIIATKGITEKISYKRKRENESDDEKEDDETSKRGKKKLKKKTEDKSEEMFVEPIPSTSRSEETSMSCSTESSSTDVEIDEEGLTKYRFAMINYLDNNVELQNRICDAWEIEKSFHRWDIMDRQSKKFIKVELSTNQEKAEAKFKRISKQLPDNSAMFIVNPGDGSIVYLNHEGHLNGETKVRLFMFNRNMRMNKNNLLETDLNEEIDVVGNVLVSDLLNKWILTWEYDSTMESFERYDDDELYGKDMKFVETIKAETIFKNLTTLEEPFRKKEVPYKAKLLPDPLPIYVRTTKDKDYEMANEYLNLLNKEHGSLKQIPEGKYEHKNKTCTLDPGVLDEVLKQWNSGRGDNFHFVTRNQMKMKEESKLLEALGVRKKKRTFTTTVMDDMKQKTFGEPEYLQYSDWIDMLFSMMNEDSPFDAITFVNLTKANVDHGHPIPMICEEIVDVCMENFLRSNSVLFASKIVNLYSRLGGAYKTRESYTNKDRASIAIFPIYSTLYFKDKETEKYENRERIVSGICLRGPTHAKNPTDKIPIVTIEMMVNIERNMDFALKIKNAIILENNNCIVIIRQNSVMKEDTIYGTFIINALFGPINLVGHATIENPSLGTHRNLKERMKRQVEDNIMYYRHRVTEGILMSVLGNSRDEGYFALLRKLFLVLHSFRNNESSGHSNITEFCEKVNETLRDNPISFHFHKTLTLILEGYSNEEHIRKMRIEERRKNLSLD